jgi:ribosomal protein L5
MMEQKMVNPMREIKLDKVVLNIAGVANKLDKGVILLEAISGKKAVRVKATKRIPGIHEYIEIPGVEYIREVGIMGFEVTVVFARAGKVVEKKKIKRGKARRLTVSREEIEDYVVGKFGTEILRKAKREAEE